MGRRQTQTLIRQWIAAGAVLALLVLTVVVMLRRRTSGPPALRGPFPTRRLSLRPLAFDHQRVPGHLRVLRSRVPYHPGCVAAYHGRCVQRLPLETYVQGVVLGEQGLFAREHRRRRRHAQALQETWKLQAIAARTYALYAVLTDKHLLKKTGFHISDTPWDQVFTPRKVAGVARAVRATAGRVLVDGRGRLVYAEYSASCGGRGTRDVVKRRQRITCHRHCKRHRYRGSSHFRGMCQWGSFLFALEGRRLPWLLARYYPNAHPVRVRYR